MNEENQGADPTECQDKAESNCQVGNKGTFIAAANRA